MTELNDAMVEALKKARTIVGKAEAAYEAAPEDDSAWRVLTDTLTNDIAAAIAIQTEAERAKIIEECAKVADAELQLAKADGPKDEVDDLIATGQIGASSRIAAAIRALALPAPPPAEGGQKG